MEHQFTRIDYLFEENQLNGIKEATVCVVGLGGVGSQALLTLARTGVSKFVICDFDIINITNCNRQIIANLKTVGKFKTDVCEEMIKSINPNAEIVKLNERFSSESKLFNYHFDYLIDAIDDVENKYLLIKMCLMENIKFISSMGTAKKFDIKKLEIIDINKTEYDPLAKIIRKKLRDDNLKVKFKCLSSKEVVTLKGPNLGSYMPVTATAGLMIADYIIKEITNKE